MLDIERLRAKPKEVEFMGDTIKIYPLKTKQIAELGELQAKNKFADATMMLIRETFNRMLQEEHIAKLIEQGKTREEAKKIPFKKLTDDDIDEFDQKSLNELMPHIMEVNGLKIPEEKDNQKKTSKQ